MKGHDSLLQRAFCWLVILFVSLKAITAHAADVTSVWNGGSGTWTESANWLHTPSLPGTTFPNNGSLTYDVEIGLGSISLISTVSVERFTLQGGVVTGGSIIASNQAVWNGGGLELSGPFVALGGLFANFSGNAITSPPVVRIYGESMFIGPVTLPPPLEWPNNGELPATAWKNNGTLTVSNDFSLVRYSSLTSFGKLRKVGPGVLNLSNDSFESVGEVEVESGGIVTGIMYASYSGLVRCASNTFVRMVNEFAIEPAFRSNVVFAGPGTLQITNGGVQDARALAAGSFVLSNAARLEISAGHFTIEGPGLIQPGSVVQLDGPGAASLRGNNLTNQGTIIMKRAGSDYYGAPALGGNIVNEGCINFQADFSYLSGGPALHNVGVIQKTSGTNSTGFWMSGLNHGLIAARAATLRLEGAITNHGRLLAETNCRLIISNPQYSSERVSAQLGEGTRFEGSGTNVLSDSVVLAGNVTNTALLELSDVYNDYLDQSPVRLSGPGALHNHGQAVVRKGSDSSGWGVIITNFHNHHEFVQRGHFAGTLSNNSTYIIEQGNFGGWDSVSAQYESAQYLVPGRVDNHGLTVKLTAGTWKGSSLSRFNNHGIFDLQEGAARWFLSGTHSGVFSVAAGHALRFLGGTNEFLDGALLTGPGTNLLLGGEWHILNRLTNAGLLVLDGGIVTGPGQLLVEPGARLDFPRGQLAANGTINIASGATAVLRFADYDNSNRVNGFVVNHGFLQISNQIWGAGRIENFGTLRANNADLSSSQPGATLSLLNHGQLFVSSGRYFASDLFTNVGSVFVESNATLGIGYFTHDTYVQFNGETIIQNSTNYSRMMIGGGTLAISGASYDTITVTNATMDIGFPYGRLAATALRLDSNSVLNIDLGGTQPGISHDQINGMNGPGIDCHAIVQIRLASGYFPSAGDTFTIFSGLMDYANYPTRFRFRGLNIGNGLRLAPSFGPGIKLVAVPVPAPDARPVIAPYLSSFIQFSWPADFRGMSLQSTTNLGSPWQTVFIVDGAGDTILPKRRQEFFRFLDFEVP